MASLKIPQKNRTFIIAASVVLLGLGGLVAMRLAPPPMQNFDFPIAVTTATVRAETIPVTYSATGTVEANRRVDLNPETPGTIALLAFTEGQPISKGQVLVRLRGDKQAANAQEAAADIAANRTAFSAQGTVIAQLEAEVAAALIRKKDAEAEFRRFNQLKDEEFVSPLELDQRRTSFDVADANYVAAQKRLEQARVARGQNSAQVAQAQARYRYNQALAGETVVRAPFSGVVGQKYVDLGDYVMPGEKLLTVVDTSVLKIRFNVPERYLGSLRIGNPVTVKAESRPGETFSGAVDFIDPVINLENRTVTVKAAMTGGAASALRDGQFADVSLYLASKPNAMVVPEEALIPQGDQFYVYRVNAGKAEMRQVKIGQRMAGGVEILSGLAPGEKVVTSGIQKLTPGAKVMEGPPPGASGKPAKEPAGKAADKGKE